MAHFGLTFLIKGIITETDGVLVPHGSHLLSLTPVLSEGLEFITPHQHIVCVPINGWLSSWTPIKVPLHAHKHIKQVLSKVLLRFVVPVLSPRTIFPLVQPATHSTGGPMRYSRVQWRNRGSENLVACNLEPMVHLSYPSLSRRLDPGTSVCGNARTVSHATPWRLYTVKQQSDTPWWLTHYIGFDPTNQISAFLSRGGRDLRG